MKVSARIVLWALLLAALGAGPAAAAKCDLTGKYEVKRFLYTIRAQILQKGDRFAMIAYIRSIVGTKYVYPFYGVIKGDKVEAQNSAGHSFSGVITPSGELKGQVLTRWHSTWDVDIGPSSRVAQWSDGVKRAPPVWKD